MNLDSKVRIRAAGIPSVITTIEDAIALIDRHLAPELKSLPRWTFARALLAEALKSGKARDVKAASRQFAQALRNEKYLDEKRYDGDSDNSNWPLVSRHFSTPKLFVLFYGFGIWPARLSPRVRAPL
jgi:hypothetical protein